MLRLGSGLSRRVRKMETRLVVVGSKPRVQHHEHSRVQFLYHKLIRAGRGGFGINVLFLILGYSEAVELHVPTQE